MLGTWKTITVRITFRLRSNYVQKAFDYVQVVQKLRKNYVIFSTFFWFFFTSPRCSQNLDIPLQKFIKITCTTSKFHLFLWFFVIGVLCTPKSAMMPVAWPTVSTSVLYLQVWSWRENEIHMRVHHAHLWLLRLLQKPSWVWSYTNNLGIYLGVDFDWYSHFGEQPGLFHIGFGPQCPVTLRWHRCQVLAGAAPHWRKVSNWQLKKQGLNWKPETFPRPGVAHITSIQSCIDIWI
jgi:hypothetical protein